MNFFERLKSLFAPKVEQNFWTDIIGHVFRVLDFDRAGTIIDGEGNVIAKSDFDPYGWLLVESPLLKEPMLLPITHRDDFLLATTIYDDPQWIEEIKKLELLVTYIPKDKNPSGFAGFSHALHYLITSRCTLEKFYEKEGKSISIKKAKKLFGDFVWDGEIGVKVNLNPI